MNQSELFLQEKRLFMNQSNTEKKQMRNEYDFSDARPGRFAGKTKQQITIRIEPETIAYFKNVAQENGLPYQTLINLYLTDCAKKKKTLDMRWD
jgi:predicted DNA binding CopG/RHH family protein